MRSSAAPLGDIKSLAGKAIPGAIRLPMKIFQIGFNRCGTSTIHGYLRVNGVSSVHWDRGRLAQRMFTNLANGDELLAGYEEFDAFTDMVYLDGSGTHLEAYKLFPYLAAQYPDAVFILNTRDREAWIRSRLRHEEGRYAIRQKRLLGVTSDEQLADLWRVDWERHHRRVTQFFAGKSYRFFVCKIEKDLPYLLNERIPECRLDPALYELALIKKNSRPKTFLRRVMKPLRRYVTKPLRRALGGSGLVNATWPSQN